MVLSGADHGTLISAIAPSVVRFLGTQPQYSIPSGDGCSVDR